MAVLETGDDERIRPFLPPPSSRTSATVDGRVEIDTPIRGQAAAELGKQGAEVALRASPVLVTAAHRDRDARTPATADDRRDLTVRAGRARVCAANAVRVAAVTVAADTDVIVGTIRAGIGRLEHHSVAPAEGRDLGRAGVCDRVVVGRVRVTLPARVAVARGGRHHLDAGLAGRIAGPGGGADAGIERVWIGVVTRVLGRIAAHVRR